MSKHHEQSGCACCGVSRRSFLATGSATCAGVAACTVGGTLPFVNTARADDGNGKMKVRVVFVLFGEIQPIPDWPNIGYDFHPVMEKTMTALNSRCNGIDFIASSSYSPDMAKTIVDDDAAAGNIDGYLVMQMNNMWQPVVHNIVASGKPVLFANYLFGGCGGFLVFGAQLVKLNTPNLAFISSSDIRDLIAAAQCFTFAKNGNIEAFVKAATNVRIERTAKISPPKPLDDPLDLLATEELLKELKGKKIIEVEASGNQLLADVLRESLGIELVGVGFAELNEFWANADKAKAQEVIKQWKIDADEVFGIPEDVMEDSARMYLTEKALLEKYGACAITINCLGGFYGKHITAYPCLGFHQLLNEGLIGACERDVLSTVAMVVMTTMTKGRPGFISDPCMDIATRQIIYAHCVASNKAFGPNGPANPFQILTHSEDRQGASIRSILPVGYMTTTVEFWPERKLILFHQAVTVANNPSDRACRTKLAAIPVGDFEKLFTEWDRYWHRVTYYGDLRDAVFSFAKAVGWEVLEEA